jgi:hypothetical protein
MTTYSVVCVIFFLFVSTGNSRDLPSEHHGRRFWHELVESITDHVDVDNRPLHKGEGMFLFTDVGFQTLGDINTWKLMVHGWRYRSSKRKDWLGFSASKWIERLAQNLIKPDDILYLNGSINHDRLEPFFFDDNSNEAIIIKVGSKTHEVRTDKYGQFYEHIELKNNDIQLLKQQQGKARAITYEAIGDDEGKSTGIIQLIEPSEGISVISDIDDTIKISEVLDKVRLLANTFIYPFKPVPGKYKKIFKF